MKTYTVCWSYVKTSICSKYVQHKMNICLPQIYVQQMFWVYTMFNIFQTYVNNISQTYVQHSVKKSFVKHMFNICLTYVTRNICCTFLQFNLYTRISHTETLLSSSNCLSLEYWYPGLTGFSLPVYDHLSTDNYAPLKATRVPDIRMLITLLP